MRSADPGSLEPLYETFRAARGVTCRIEDVQPGDLFLAFQRSRPRGGLGRAAWDFLERTSPGLLRAGLGLAGRLRFSHWLSDTPRREGNALATEALARGATGAVVDRAAFCRDPRIRLVPDVREALLGLAALHRRKVGARVLAITGSNGKTTTTRLIEQVLSGDYRTARTHENRNNIPGVPLTLLAAPPDTQVALVEMGITRPGQLTELCELARPECGLITNIGPTHLDHLGSVDGVQAAKGELFRYLRGTCGRLLVNLNDARVAALAEALAGGYSEVVTFGSSPAAGVRGEIAAADPFLRVRWLNPPSESGMPACPLEVQTRFTGRHHLDTVLAAVAAGVHFNVRPRDIVRAIEAFAPLPNRGELVRRGSVTILLDAWNANPASMTVALAQLAERPEPHRVAVLGEMLDLGRQSDEAHHTLLQRLKAHELSGALLIGRGFARVRDRSFGEYCATPQAARRWLAARRFENACLLLKGSRRLGLERLLDAIAPGDGG